MSKTEPRVSVAVPADRAERIVDMLRKLDEIQRRSPEKHAELMRLLVKLGTP